MTLSRVRSHGGARTAAADERVVVACGRNAAHFKRQKKFYETIGRARTRRSSETEREYKTTTTNKQTNKIRRVFALFSHVPDTTLSLAAFSSLKHTHVAHAVPLQQRLCSSRSRVSPRSVGVQLIFPPAVVEAHGPRPLAAAAAAARICVTCVVKSAQPFRRVNSGT